MNESTEQADHRLQIEDKVHAAIRIAEHETFSESSETPKALKRPESLYLIDSHRKRRLDTESMVSSHVAAPSAASTTKLQEATTIPPVTPVFSSRYIETTSSKDLRKAICANSFFRAWMSVLVPACFVLLTIGAYYGHLK